MPSDVLGLAFITLKTHVCGADVTSVAMLWSDKCAGAASAIGFVTYKNRSSAEFAKIAMADQTLDNGEVRLPFLPPRHCLSLPFLSPKCRSLAFPLPVLFSDTAVRCISFLRRRRSLPFHPRLSLELLPPRRC